MSRKSQPSLKRFVSILMGLVAAIAVFFFFLNSIAAGWSRLSGTFQLADQKQTPHVSLEIASTAAERQKGLMYRRELPKGQGMLFVFPEEKPQSFWMKNTYIPLDLIFLDRHLKIVDIIQDAKPLDESPLQTDKLAMYVIELQAGSVGNLHVSVGDEFHPNGPIPRGVK